MNAEEVFKDFATLTEREKELATLLANQETCYISWLAIEMYGDCTTFDINTVNMYLTKLKKHLSPSYELVKTIGVVKLQRKPL